MVGAALGYRSRAGDAGQRVGGAQADRAGLRHRDHLLVRWRARTAPSAWCDELVAENPGKYFYPDQYSNESNPRAHYLGTGREIWEQTGERVTHFVAGIGTTGTIMGTGRRPQGVPTRDVQIVAVEPDDALHGLEGLKHLPSSLVPAIWHPDGIVDRRLPLGTDEAWDTAEEIARRRGSVRRPLGGRGRRRRAARRPRVPASADRVHRDAHARSRRSLLHAAASWEKHYEW